MTYEVVIALLNRLPELAPNVVITMHVECKLGDDYWGEYDVDKGFTFTASYDALDSTRQEFVVAHEYAHYLTSGHHDEQFYVTLTNLLLEEVVVPWAIAREMEQMYPREWER